MRNITKLTTVNVKNFEDDITQLIGQIDTDRHRCGKSLWGHCVMFYSDRKNDLCTLFPCNNELPKLSLYCFKCHKHAEGNKIGLEIDPTFSDDENFTILIQICKDCEHNMIDDIKNLPAFPYIISIYNELGAKSIYERDLICEHCTHFFSKIQECTKCRGVRYCSRECQVADWNNHKMSCNKNFDEHSSYSKYIKTTEGYKYIENEYGPCADIDLFCETVNKFMCDGNISLYIADMAHNICMVSTIGLNDKIGVHCEFIMFVDNNSKTFLESYFLTLVQKLLHQKFNIEDIGKGKIITCAGFKIKLGNVIEDLEPMLHILQRASNTMLALTQIIISDNNGYFPEEPEYKGPVQLSLCEYDLPIKFTDIYQAFAFLDPKLFKSICKSYNCSYKN